MQYDPGVRRARILLKATLSPAGLVAGGAVAAGGIALGIGIPWIVGAGLAAWMTSVVLHLRDRALVSALLAPQFDRDLGALEGEHRQLMKSGLAAADRFDRAVETLPDAADFGGMRARVTDALERLFDSLVWAQRADQFLRAVNPRGIRERLSRLAPDSPVAAELRAQLEEIAEVDERRSETMARSMASVTGIETLAVKVGSLALESSAPGASDHTADIRDLRRELDGYLEGLEEIQEVLRSLPPEPA